MKVLVACEESQTVCKAFRAKGHETYSADLQDCSGGHPEWHIQGDVLPLLNGNCNFVTRAGKRHEITGKWDLIIAHPPCTYLTISGNRWFNIEKYGEYARERLKARDKAIEFVKTIFNANCERVAIENPIGVLSSRWRKPTQVIQPYMFGDNAKKSTCLWVRGMPPLLPDTLTIPKLEYKEWVDKKGKKKRQPLWYAKAWHLPDKERQKVRSKTFEGIAKAMAEQWG